MFALLGLMFPTGVGMNRLENGITISSPDVPHRRGDEPYIFPSLPSLALMFPTGVGMNRYIACDIFALYNVPHRRGDEPVSLLFQAWLNLCSPQAWG